MSGQEERPSLDSRKRRAPRPAGDEGVDPIDYRPSEVPAAAQRAEETPAPGSSPAESSPAADPASVTPAAPITAPAPAPVIGPRGRPRREVTLPFSTRLSEDVLNLIDEAVANGEGGGVIRHVVEEAIRARWGHK